MYRDWDDEYKEVGKIIGSVSGKTPDEAMAQIVETLFKLKNENKIMRESLRRLKYINSFNQSEHEVKIIKIIDETFSKVKGE